ncbi:MAG: O-antigen ligase family protein [Solirubrobacteraceae bacterium]
MIAQRPAPGAPWTLRLPAGSDALPLVLGLVPVGLMLVWAVHDGGYDADTWYWGALVCLALLGTIVVGLRGRLRCAGGAAAALGLFAAYVAWCYASISWAQSPGDALQGANQALAYLLMFAVVLLAPWRTATATAALVIYAVGVGAIAVVLLFRLASADDVASLVSGGRLAAPTGYFSATAALFQIGALVGILLAARRELPGMLRGLLLALACAELQLCVTVQSRGWLFTLPIVCALAIVVARDRLRAAAAAVLPALGVLVIVGRLLAVFPGSGAGSANAADAAAGRPALLICFGVLVLGTLLSWADRLSAERSLPVARRRIIGAVIAALVAVAVLGGGTYATHGHPISFVAREFNGFSHTERSVSTASHFGDVGSGRYDFWRVSLDAFMAHPIGGLGEDNFHDYYITRRRTGETPYSTHSLELRLLAQTGAVGFALFAAFLACALRLALRGRRQHPEAAAAVAGAALTPLIVWVVYGSVDWFWEMPALSGPALGFLALAGALGTWPREPVPTGPVQSFSPLQEARGRPGWSSGRGIRRGAALTAAAAFLAAAIALGLPYLSVREVSLGVDASASAPQVALADFARAAALNPLSAVPGRYGGMVALSVDRNRVALARFRQSIAREPGGWLAWLGAGLAESALGNAPAAADYLRRAQRIDHDQPAIEAAVKRVRTRHPLTYGQAQRLLAAS